MLTLTPGAVCDVCAEEYGPHCVPHFIPCGHVLCKKCCDTIIQKLPPRATVPVCPFCREQFNAESIRLIRIDWTASRWNTPRFRSATLIEANDPPPPLPEVPKGVRLPFVEPGYQRTRAEARRLEDKVAKVASKKCSVEEVSLLHKELQDWLTSEDEETSSLSLSAALLHAILMNHLAHQEATKQARIVQANLQHKIDDLEMINEKLEFEVRRHRMQNGPLSPDSQSLRSGATSPSSATSMSRSSSRVTSPTSPHRRQSVSTTHSPPMSPTPAPLYSPQAQSAASRFAASHGHMRSASAAAARPPAPPPVRPSQTPAPTKSRMASTPAPPPLPRTPSSAGSDGEKHERWIPPRQPEPPVPRGPSRFGFHRPKTPSVSRSSATPQPYHRYATPANSP